MTGPRKGVAYEFYTALTATTDSPDFQVDPTLAAGDVKVRPADGTASNIATLPTCVDTDAAYTIKVNLDSDEMNSTNIVIEFMDAAGAEWHDLLITIQPDATWDAQASDYTTAGTFGNVLRGTLQDSDASMSTDIASDVWGFATRGLSSNPSPASDVWGFGTRTLSSIDVTTDVATELRNIHLDHMFAVATTTDEPGAAGAVMNDLIEDNAGTWRFSCDALAQAPTGSAGSGDKASDIWDAATTDYTTAGTYGLMLDNQISGLNDIATSDVAAELATYDAPTKAEMDAAFSSDVLSSDDLSTDIAIGLATLNDIATSDVAAELVTYDAPTKAEMDAAFSSDVLSSDDLSTDIAIGLATLTDVAASDVWAFATRTPTALSTDAAYDVWSEIMDSNATFHGVMRGMAAVLMGKSTGGGTTTDVFRDIGDNKDRITATVDSDGNRTAVTLDLT